MKTIIKIGIMTYGQLSTHISHLTRLARMSMQILRRETAHNIVLATHRDRFESGVSGSVVA